MGRHKKPCPANIEPLLGTLPDNRVARIAGVSPGLAKRWRIEREICGSSHMGGASLSLAERTESKYPGLVGRLGTTTDAGLADDYGLSRERVRQIREAVGKSKYQPPIPECLREAVGKFPDKALANLFDMKVSHVQRLRQSQDVPAYQKWRERLDALQPLLGKFADNRLAVLGGVPSQYLSRERLRLGIASFTVSPAHADFQKLDREVIRRLVEKGHTDDEIAILLECNGGSVAQIRTGELKLYKNGKGRGPTLTKYKIGKIRKMYREGASVRSIAEATGHSWGTVKKYVRKISREGGSSA